MTQSSNPRITVASGMMLLVLAAVWGGSFFFAEIALLEVPPLTITLHRVFWSVPTLWIVVRMLRIPVPRSPRIWLSYLVMGALNNAIPFSLIFWGQTQIDSGLASILNATTAVFGAVVAGLLLADEPLTGRKIAGALFGLAGVAVIMGGDLLAGFDLRNLAQLAILGAALCYAFASVWGKVALKGIAPQMNAFGMLAGSMVLMIPVVFVVDGVPEVSLSLPVWGALLGLAAFSTALAYLLYFVILLRAGAANLMLVTLMIPPFAIALGVAFLGETLEQSASFGFLLIAMGLLVTDGRVFDLFRCKGSTA